MHVFNRNDEQTVQYATTKEYNTIKGAKKRKILRKDFSLYLMLLVPFIILFIYRYLPLFGLIIAFKNYNIVDGFLGSPWVGLKWFYEFFGSDNFLKLLRNSVLINVYELIWGFPIPIILALLLNEINNAFFKRTVQTISYLPHFLSNVVVVGIIMQLLSPTTGVVNAVLEKIGLEPIYFLTRPEWFRTIYVASGIWQGAGWGSIIYLAALAAIDPELYESAVIDGANRFRQTIHITLPSILPTIIILLILEMGKMLDVGFEKIILMYNPLTYETADVIDTFVYRRGLGQMEYSYSTAVGLFKSVISLIMIITANKISKKVSETSLW
jgi:putative aldouronate transport system permease protein